MKQRVKLPKDYNAAGVLRALRLAAQDALELARRTNTPCYVMGDGKIVDLCKAASKRKAASAGLHGRQGKLRSCAKPSVRRRAA